MFNSDLFSDDLKRSIGDKPLREVAKQSGVSPSMLSRICNGKLPSLDTLGILCHYMHVSVDRYYQKGVQL